MTIWIKGKTTAALGTGTVVYTVRHGKNKGAAATARWYRGDEQLTWGAFASLSDTPEFGADP